MDINSSIRELKGIGEKTGKTFEKLGVYSVRDMLLAFPRDYRKMPIPEKIEAVVTGRECALDVVICTMPVVKNMRSMTLTFVKAADTTGEIQLVWFRSPYIKNSIKAKERYIICGRPLLKNNQLTIEQPEVYSLKQYQELSDTYQPVYTLTAGITNNLFRKTMKQACELVTEEIDFFPTDILERQNLISYPEAIWEIHFPTDLERLQAAHDRLAFNEFFLFILQMKQLKENREKLINRCRIEDTSLLPALIEQLPYELTNAQKQSLEDIITDMQSPYMMQRLLQGDVGSGKTIVAFLAMAAAAQNGYQAAIMAPTEVLARQHYDNFTKWCSEFSLDFPVLLLTGSLTQKQKREVYDRMKSEKSALIIGTHALIQEKAEFHKLGLVVTDEQHRFGVRQREIFSEKGIYPHILVMSATPIPRTLAIILYGDIDISVMNELPADRLPVKNCVVEENFRGQIDNFIKKEVAGGHQVYIICPLVAESEAMEAQNVIDYTQHLSEKLDSGISTAYLHGKMKAGEKNEIMEAFSQNQIQVLVSTTVIEVGVNVPNATLMIVENAERFGLAQLHQLRGRVGRGEAQSYCILVNASKAKQAGKRLDILNKSNDGFEIAKMDLKTRGPGDFFGIRQSGIFEFQVGDVFNDAGLLSKAADECGRILKEDPLLESEKNKRLSQALKDYRILCGDKLNI